MILEAGSWFELEREHRYQHQKVISDVHVPFTVFLAETPHPIRQRGT
jgi:hypothetical protein